MDAIEGFGICGSILEVSGLCNAELARLDAQVHGCSDLIHSYGPLARELNLKNRYISPLCPHNDRGDISVSDVAEHVGNGELGSAARDAIESDIGQAVIEAVKDIVETIGEELNKE